MDIIKCAGCFKNIHDIHLKCCGCMQTFDLECANIPEQVFRSTFTKERIDAWMCCMCKSKQPKSDNTNTPVRAAIDGVNFLRGAATRNCLEVSPAEQSSIMELDDTAHNATLELTDMQIIVMELKLLRSEMKQEMKANRVQLEVMNENLCNVISRVVICEDRLDKIDERLKILEQRKDISTISEGEPPSVDLLASINTLRGELNDRDQDLLLNDVEISCIPEHKGESLQHIVSSLANKLGVELNNQDVVSAVRVGRVPVSSSSVAESGLTGSHPRPIVVRLARRMVRDQLLQAARVRRGATTEGIGLPDPPRRFYINERLTRVNRQLFRRARELGDRLRWRFVWTKEGKIYVRQSSESNSPRLRVRSEDDLARIFGREAVGS